MKLLYIGSHHCSLPTFKRLMLLSQEMAFVDRASVSFGNWGTVGTDSPIRRIVPAFEGQPIKVRVHPAAISGPADRMLVGYIQADIANRRFREVFLDGLRNDKAFAEKFVQSKAKYGDGPGAAVIEALTTDHRLLGSDLGGPSMEGAAFTVRDAVGRRDTLRTLLADASIRLTNAMVIAANHGYSPVADDPFLAELLMMRTTDPCYVGGMSSVAPLVGLEVARAVIPDEALDKLTVKDILQYRRKARDAYEAWFADIDSLAVQLEETPASELNARIGKIIRSDVAPRLLEYKREMESARDELFGDLMKAVLKWEVPALSLGYFCGLTLVQAISAFLAALSPAVAATAEYGLKRRRIRRKHTLSYLIGISPRRGRRERKRAR